MHWRKWYSLLGISVIYGYFAHKHLLSSSKTSQQRKITNKRLLKFPEGMFYVQGNRFVILESFYLGQLSVICLLYSSVVHVIYFSLLFSTAYVYSDYHSDFIDLTE